MADKKDKKSGSNKINYSKRADVFANLSTGLGGPVDRSQYSYFQRGHTLWETELDSMYEQDALASRIVDRVVDDATREGFVLSGSDEEFDFASLQSSLENYNIMGVVNKAWKQARLYGGALIVLAVNDGRTYEDPLDKANLTNLIGMRVVPAFRARPAEYNFGMGASSYLNPKYYLIQEVNGKQKKIHHSRCIRIDANPNISDRRRIEINNGWGPSILQKSYKEISDLGQAMGYLSGIMHNISTPVWKIDGLNDKYCGADGQDSDMQKMVETTYNMVDNYHVLLMDTKDIYEILDRSVANLDSVIDKFVDAVVRATDMPRLIVLGEQPGGINNSADGEVSGWYDSVHSEQKNFLTPILNAILELIFIIREHKGKEVPTEWNITYNPLWQLTAQEKADTLLKSMQAFQIATMNGYMTSEQVTAKLISEGYIEDSLDSDDNVTKVPGIENPEEVSAVDEESQLAQASTEPVPPDLVNTKEAAKAVGVPTMTINNLCRKGSLPFWQFGSRVQVSMSDVMKAGRVDATSKYVNKLDANSIGLFFRSNQKDLEPLLHNGIEIPHHITYLVMEDIKGKHREFEEVVRQSLKGLGPIEVSLSGKEKLGEGIVANAEFDKDLNMARKMLINMLEMHGFVVNTKFPDWKPHMTLAYADKYEGPEPEDFVIDEVEIWGLGHPIVIKLT